MFPERRGVHVQGAFIDALSWEEALDRVETWARNRESRYVCLSNVHSVVTASRDAAFRQVVNHADMATPDGAPVAWMLRLLGFPGQARINGPDLMWKYCELAQRSGQSIYLYGSAQTTLELLLEKIREAFPDLKIAGSASPPFRPLTEAEDAEDVGRINQSGANVVFVSLGCPKQETWMATHRGRVNALMLGVGAAFDYHAGISRRAPAWMQDAGLEWLHRLVFQPRRLWRRYLVTNTLFLIGATKQLLLGQGRKPRD